MRDVRQLASLPDDFQSAAKGIVRSGRAKPAAPFSLRLSAQERARLEADAGGLPLGEYIRRRVFADGASPPPDPAAHRGPRKPRARPRRAGPVAPRFQPQPDRKGGKLGLPAVGRELEAELAAACADACVGLGVRCMSPYEMLRRSARASCWAPRREQHVYWPASR